MKLPEKKYAVIYADPPWSYRQHGTGPKSRGNAAQHYHTMTVEDICALPVRQLAGGGQGCALFMWATFPTIPDALKVMDAWGFNPGGMPGLAVRTAGRYSCAWEWHRRRAPAY